MLTSKPQPGPTHLLHRFHSASDTGPKEVVDFQTPPHCPALLPPDGNATAPLPPGPGKNRETKILMRLKSGWSDRDHFHRRCRERQRTIFFRRQWPAMRNQRRRRGEVRRRAPRPPHLKLLSAAASEVHHNFARTDGLQYSNLEFSLGNGQWWTC